MHGTLPTNLPMGDYLEARANLSRNFPPLSGFEETPLPLSLSLSQHTKRPNPIFFNRVVQKPDL